MSETSETTPEEKPKAKSAGRPKKEKIITLPVRSLNAVALGGNKPPVSIDVQVDAEKLQSGEVKSIFIQNNKHTRFNCYVGVESEFLDKTLDLKKAFQIHVENKDPYEREFHIQKNAAVAMLVIEYK